MKLDLFQAVVLGLLQGITEWLPISSQGQVSVAALQLFGVGVEAAMQYAIFLHIGTLIAAIIYFRNEIINLLKLQDNKMLKFLAVAVLATAVTALPSYLIFRSIATSAFVLMLAVGVFLIVTGLIQKYAKKRTEGKLSLRNAVFLGLGQGFSILPGISRSGMTTSVLLFEGFDPEKAFRISFLLSVPSIFIAEILFNILEFPAIDANAIIAVAVAAVAGYFSMDILIRVASKINFSLFCIAFGIVYLLLAFI